MIVILPEINGLLPSTHICEYALSPINLIGWQVSQVSKHVLCCMLSVLMAISNLSAAQAGLGKILQKQIGAFVRKSNLDETICPI